MQIQRKSWANNIEKRSKEVPAHLLLRYNLRHDLIVRNAKSSEINVYHIIIINLAYNNGNEKSKLKKSKKL